MKRWLGYILFGIGAITVFLYLLFPAKSVKAYIVHQLHQIDPRLTLAAKDPVLRLPPGIKLRDADIRLNNIPLIRWESISFFPRIKTLFADQRIVRYHGRAYKGEAIGDLFLAQEGEWGFKGTADGFQAELMPLAAMIPQGLLKGALTGTYELALTKQGTLNLTITSGSITLNEPLLEIETIKFDQLTVDAVIDHNQMQINTVQMTGPEIDATLAGQVTLMRPLGDSFLNMTGVIKPHPIFIADLRKKLPPGFISDQIVKKGVSLQINGAISAPEVFF